ncbi:hypothetical protein JZ751_009185 [Albula glossodonta]|uniref:Uncharacterized protein n=1 Tax=Albula glossodonta TaxID=121402 RepID=A0A8T2N1W2_9TELE|nr:hypothetical protein JZ751_009185 [Albula glossodonta]
MSDSVGTALAWVIVMTSSSHILPRPSVDILLLCDWTERLPCEKPQPISLRLLKRTCEQVSRTARQGGAS